MSSTILYQLRVCLSDFDHCSNYHVIMFGDNGDTGKLMLQSYQRYENVFDLKVTDIGEIKEINFIQDNSTPGEKWNVNRVSIFVPSSTMLYYFRSKVDNPLVWRMSERKRDGNRKKIGDEAAGSTDAKVQLIIWNWARMAILMLQQSDKFQRGKTATFNLEGTDIGEITKIEISQENSTPGASRFVDSVEIKIPSCREKYLFKREKSGCLKKIFFDYKDEDEAKELVNTAVEAGGEKRAPKFVLKPELQLIRKGETAKFKASFDGSPKPSLSWNFNGKIIMADDRHKIYSEKEMHILAISNPLPAEIGTYQVRIKNTEGEATASADLKLVDDIKSVQPDTKKLVNTAVEAGGEKRAPKFVLKPEQQLIRKGETATFKTSFDGSPKPSLSWNFNGKIIMADDRHKIYSEKDMHILAILNPLPAEIGNYQVRLKNTEGEATASADLTLVDASKPKAGHIMLSYNKFSKEMVLRIYKELQGNGFKVWIDIYDMKGDTFDAMAEAVEDASIFIMCMSSGYQESKNCEKEAKFAETLGKTIIPLKLEKDFSPRRWLGLILGTKMFFDFSGKYPIEGKMKELLQEIERIYKS